jgi:transcriptional regulator with XRE-family HTH domain
MEDKYKTNRLIEYRKRMGFNQKTVAQLLGLKDASLLSRYESGSLLPTLESALTLEIIYRVPVAFLFPNLYEAIRSKIRDHEEKISTESR